MDRQERLTRQLQRLGVEVSDQVAQRLLWFLEELLRWNRSINLTAITDPIEGIEKHLVDSLTLAPLLTGEERLLDIGSGAGLPCIPLQIVLGGVRTLSVDSVGKKIAFQRHAARTLGLEGFEALHCRAQTLPEREGCAKGFDLVVSRAFSSIPAFVDLALPCLAPEGRIVAMKGAEGERELAESASHLHPMGLTCTSVRRLLLPASGAERTLIVLQRK